MRSCLVVLLLAGCAALTPEEMRRREPAVSFESKKAPRDAARCMALAAENWKPPYTERFSAQWREADAGGFEVVVLMMPLASTAVVGDVMPGASGARVRLWTQHQRTFFREMTDVMADGCR